MRSLTMKTYSDTFIIQLKKKKLKAFSIHFHTSFKESLSANYQK